jgi:hypothetical protein
MRSLKGVFMYLARGKDGKLGRMVRSLGEHAVVAAASPVVAQRNVIVSNESIHRDQQLENVRLIRAAQAKVAQDQARARASQAQAIAFENNRRRAVIEQMRRPKDRVNETLKGYFGAQADMSETERVNRSLKADFYDREQVPGEHFDEGNWGFNVQADYRTNALTGSPVSRDGSFGPSTDYDRFVYGTELDNDTVQMPDGGDGSMIVGGTMMGRYDGRSIKYRPKSQMGRPTGRSWKGRHRYSMGHASMGDDVPVDPSADMQAAIADTGAAPDQSAPDPTAAEAVTDPASADTSATPVDTSSTPSFWSNLGTSFASGVAQATPGAIMTLATGQKVPMPGQSAASAAATKKVAAISSATNPVAKMAATIGVPPVVLYAGLGAAVLSVGYLLMKKR